MSPMKNADAVTTRTAALTGLPDLAHINDPERLENLAHVARGIQQHQTLDCPLRYKVAIAEYIKTVDAKLEACGVEN